MPDITQLPVGHQFAPFRHELLPEKVAAYVQAVEEINPLDAVPPLALAAYESAETGSRIDMAERYAPTSAFCC